MFQKYWLRITELFGRAGRGLKRRARKFRILLEVTIAVMAEEILRITLSPIIDFALPSAEFRSLAPATALVILIYIRLSNAKR